MTNKDEEMKDEIITDCRAWSVDYMLKKMNEFLKAHDKRLLEEVEKAYGGCHKCYGKGYSTVRYGYSTAPDFHGDKEIVEPPKTRYEPCSCERGKQIAELLVKKREE